LICIDAFKARESECVSQAIRSEPHADFRDGMTGELDRVLQPYLPSLLADSEKWWRSALSRTGYREA